MARKLQKVLEYKRWDKFNNVINNVKIACKKSYYSYEDHFSQVGETIELAKEAKRTILDYKLSRYACYLIVQNAEVKNFDKFHNYDYKNSDYRGKCFK